MAVLSISSYVSRGYVGNRTISFALETLGIEVVAFPTVLFSNHPGNSSYRGFPIDATDLIGFFEELNKTSDLNNLDLVLSGYIGNVNQVSMIVDIVNKIKKMKDKLYICDPIIGNEKGMFVDPKIAEKIKHNLVPLADIITPNQFELEYLSGKEITNINEMIASSEIVIDMGAKSIVLTSCHIENELVSVFCLDDKEGWLFKVPLLLTSSNGAGDLFSALLSYYVCYMKMTLKSSVEKTVNTCWSVIKNSIHPDDIEVIKFLKSSFNERINIYSEKVI
tara:strand:+ start:574 stop:1407 length:834 start_codon:yes stop_codon:yes gene_type:complete